MQRVTHVTRAVDLFGAGKDGYQAGDPEAEIPATVLTAEAVNAMQEEIARAVEVFTPLDAENPGQLAAALGVLVETRETVRTVQLRGLSGLPDSLATDAVGWMRNPSRDWLTGRNQGVLPIDLSPYIEPRGHLTKVSFRIETSARTGTNRMRFELFRQSSAQNVFIVDPNLSRTSQLGATTYADEAGGEQLVEIEFASSSSPFYALVRAASGTPPAGDTLMSVSVSYWKTGL